MHRVLLPIDEDESRARAQAAAVAALPNAPEEVTVDVVHVHEADKPDTSLAPGAGFDAYAKAVRENLESLEPLPATASVVVELLESAGIDHAVHEIDGDPAEAILALADEYGSDQIVMAARTQSAVGKVLFGSVTQAVILHSDCPVTTVRAD